MGWSQGGLIAGLLAASDPQHQLVAGLGLLSVAPAGFVIPGDLLVSGEVQRILFTAFPEALTPTQSDIDEILFGTDPLTGKPTISPDALTAFSAPPFSQPESSIAILQEAEICPGFLGAVPGLIASTLFNSLGSTTKQLIIFPRNSHGWFLEDNHDATMRVFDHFLSQF
jgi:pimeloyl-ACP methyl ester carboxylesterase